MDKHNLVYLFVSSVAWGATFPLAKVLLGKITPLTYVILRLVFGLAVLFPIIARRKSWSEFGRFWREDRRVFLILGLIITPGSFLLEFYGIRETTPINQSIIINLQAIVVVIIQVAFYKLRVRPTIWIGSVIAFIGIYFVIARPGEALSGGVALFGVGTLLGDILTIFTGIGWGAYTAVGEKAVHRFDPLVVSTAIFCCCLVVFIPLWVIEGGYVGLLLLDGWEWLMLVFLGAICTGIAYWIWYEACRSVPAEKVAMFVYVSPLAAIVISVGWLGDSFTWAIAIGFLLTMIGVTIAERSGTSSSKAIEQKNAAP